MDENNLQRNIVLYDSDCGFCSSCKDFSASKNKQINFIDIESECAKQILINRKIINNRKTIFYITEKKVFRKSQAIASIFETFPWPWKIIYFLWKIIPIKFSDYSYDFIVKHKNKFSKSKTCNK